MIIAASGSEVNPTDLPGCDRVGYRALDHRDGHPFPVADPRQQVVLSEQQRCGATQDGQDERPGEPGEVPKPPKRL